MSIRRRLAPEESRRVALEAARQQLIEGGPQSVTLKSVAARIGRTHANLLHHFGSAAGLQQELAAYLAVGICETITVAAYARRHGEASPRDLVDLTFDAFDSGGAGALASWILLNGQQAAMIPVIETILRLMQEFAPDEVGQTPDRKALHGMVHTMIVMALGDALMGAQLAGALGVPRTAPREAAAQWLDSLVRMREYSGLQPG
jgi:AcrR family transcriptional regulator